MKQHRILAFGIIAEKIDAAETTIEGANDSEELLRILYLKYPQLSGMKFTVSINRKIIHGNQLLAEGDEIGLLPPFSGG
ncbi:hypothetical protein MASR2M18_11130 [Ignavibacteria bacterium]|nr:MoaD/ThiS family protein [Bacteroidota bacterium]MCZ2133354.1 MoaD/ThiS family protein [Bacteroidota bacterium]